MKIIRKIILFFTTLTFIGLLFLTAGAWTINHTVARKDTVKSWLRESGAYEHFVDEVVNMVKQKQSNDLSKSGNTGDTPNIDIATLQTAAEKTFTPTFLSKNLEGVLDGVYAWLDGTTPQLNFSLDLSQAKKNFATELGNVALTKAATLPACTTIPTDGFDPLSATCLPKGVNVNAEVQKFVTNFQTSKDVLPDPIVTADQLKVNSNGTQQRIDQAFPSIPKWFQLGKSAALVLTGLTVLWAIFVLLLGTTRRYGLKHLAKGFILVSLTLTCTSLILRPATTKLSEAFLKSRADASSFSQKIILPLIQRINVSNKQWGLVFAAIYGFIGLGIVIFLLATKKHKHPEDTKKEEPKTGPAVSTELPTPKIHPESVVAVKTSDPKGPPEIKTEGPRPGGKSVQG